MLSTTIDVRGMKGFQKAMRESPRDLKDEIEKAMKKAVFKAEGEIKPITPVDTGRMRASIKHYIQPLEGEIFPTVDYAIYVHEGTKYMGARPFMEQGLNYAKPSIEDYFRNAIQNSLDKIALRTNTSS